MKAPNPIPARARFSWLRLGFIIVVIAASTTASPQEGDLDHDDAMLAYAQCMRDNGFEEFPDPSPDGRLQMRVTPDSAPRFRTAQEACRDIAPEGWGDHATTPEELEALVAVAQCIREHGVPDFPDPDAEGRFNPRAIGLGPDDPKLREAMETCTAEVGGGRGRTRIMIGG